MPLINKTPKINNMFLLILYNYKTNVKSFEIILDKSFKEYVTCSAKQDVKYQYGVIHICQYSNYSILIFVYLFFFCCAGYIFIETFIMSNLIAFKVCFIFIKYIIKLNIILISFKCFINFRCLVYKRTG